MAKDDVSEQDAILDAWADGKATRDAAIAAAWELEDPEERRAALADAKAAWRDTKADLIARQTAVDANPDKILAEPDKILSSEA